MFNSYTALKLVQEPFPWDADKSNKTLTYVLHIAGNLFIIIIGLLDSVLLTSYLSVNVIWYSGCF